MARLRSADVVRLASRGLRGHPGRFLLSALGIAIGVAAMVAVAGTTASSRSQLNDMLARLGTNVIRVYPAPALDGSPTRLPATATAMLGRIGPVTTSSGIAQLADVGVYRNDHVPSGNTNSVAVDVVDPTLLATLRGTTALGHWFTAANQHYPTTVLGSAAAQRLGVDRLGTRVWIAQQWWVVICILDPLPLAPDLDGTAMIPAAAARTFARSTRGDGVYDGTSTAVYLRTDPDQVVAVSGVIAPTASPQHPEQVGISRPTDALTAQLTANDTMDRLLLGLAAIGLLVGGIGISNTMIIAVIERRPEIGLRRSLGASKGNIATQFLAESALMSATGGAAGVVIGYVVTAIYAHLQGWSLCLPAWVGAAALVLTVAVGTLAGLYPAIRASRESPTQALSSA